MPRPKGSPNCTSYKYIVYDSTLKKNTYFTCQHDIAKGHNITFSLVKRRLSYPNIPKRGSPNLTIQRLETPLAVYATIRVKANLSDNA